LVFAILHNWILGFGIEVVVPIEEGFTGSPPEEDDPADLAQDSIAMSATRDSICDAMWEGRGHQGFDWNVICYLFQLLGPAMELMFVL
jgi:hypothetical protein